MPTAASPDLTLTVLLTFRHRAALSLLALSEIAFVASLPLDAWHALGGTEKAPFSYTGFTMLTIGFLGPLLWQVGWWANPLLFVSWLSVGVAHIGPLWRRAALACAGAAVLIAATSFVTLRYGQMFGRHEGEMAEHASFGVAIFTWLASCLLALLAAAVTPTFKASNNRRAQPAET